MCNSHSFLFMSDLEFLENVQLNSRQSNSWDQNTHQKSILPLVKQLSNSKQQFAHDQHHLKFVRFSLNSHQHHLIYRCIEKALQTSHLLANYENILLSKRNLFFYCIQTLPGRCLHLLPFQRPRYEWSMVSFRNVWSFKNVLHPSLSNPWIQAILSDVRSHCESLNKIKHYLALTIGGITKASLNDQNESLLLDSPSATDSCMNRSFDQNDCREVIFSWREAIDEMGAAFMGLDLKAYRLHMNNEEQHDSIYDEFLQVNQSLEQALKVLDNQIQSHQKPSKWAKYWFPTLLGVYTFWQASQLFYRNNTAIWTALMESQTLIKNFCKDWIWDPLLEIFKTIRHQNPIALSSAQTLKSDLSSLERMVLDYATEARLLPEMSTSAQEALLDQIRHGDLSLVLQKYEQNIKSPLTNIVTGDMIRLLLIQVQKAKVDLEVSMSALDKLLKSNELNFAFLAVVPTLLITYYLYATGKQFMKNQTGRSIRKVMTSIRNSLRQIDCIVNIQFRKENNQTFHDTLSLGNYMIEIHVMRQHLLQLSTRNELRIAFEKDLNELEQPAYQIVQHYNIIQLMWHELYLLSSQR